MKEKKEAAKYGKAIAPLVSQNSAYESTSHKLKKNPEMALFLNQVS